MLLFPDNLSHFITSGILFFIGWIRTPDSLAGLFNGKISYPNEQGFNTLFLSYKVPEFRVGIYEF